MSSDKRTMWVQATVVILLAGLGYVMVVAYARGYGQVDGSQQADAAVQSGPPGAPTREQVAQLHESLRNQLGVNARGLSRVAHVDYDGWPDRLHVVFALDETPSSMTPVQAKELRPLLDVLHAVQAGGLQWRWVLVSGTAPTSGFDGHVAEAMVVRAIFSREKLDKADWQHLSPDALPAMAEQWYVDPDLSHPRPNGPTAPAAAPTTAPSAPGPDGPAAKPAN